MDCHRAFFLITSEDAVFHRGTQNSFQISFFKRSFCKQIRLKPFNPYGVGTALIRFNIVTIMVADALAFASPGHQHPWDGDYLEYVSSCLIRGMISTICVMSAWRNDINCSYIFMFSIKKIARKGLMHCHHEWCVIVGRNLHLLLDQHVECLKTIWNMSFYIYMHICTTFIHAITDSSSSEYPSIMKIWNA